mgnify:CR=1 FL=1
MRLGWGPETAEVLEVLFEECQPTTGLVREPPVVLGERARHPTQDCAEPDVLLGYRVAPCIEVQFRGGDAAELVIDPALEPLPEEFLVVAEPSPEVPVVPTEAPVGVDLPADAGEGGVGMPQHGDEIRTMHGSSDALGLTELRPMRSPRLANSNYCWEYNIAALLLKRHFVLRHQVRISG